MGNGFNDFMLVFLYWTVSQNNMLCYSGIFLCWFCLCLLGCLVVFFSPFKILNKSKERVAYQQYWLAELSRAVLPSPHTAERDWKETNLLQATQGEGGCTACYHLTCFCHAYIMLHITIISQHSQYLPLTPPSIILYWTKNAQRPNQRVMGKHLTQWAQPSPCLWLGIMWLSQYKGKYFPLISSTSYHSVRENTISQKLYFLLATMLLTCFVVPGSEFLFPFVLLFLAMRWDLCAAEVHLLELQSLKDTFLWNTYYFPSRQFCCCYISTGQIKLHRRGSNLSENCFWLFLFEVKLGHVPSGEQREDKSLWIKGGSRSLPSSWHKGGK